LNFSSNTIELLAAHFCQKYLTTAQYAADIKSRQPTSVPYVLKPALVLLVLTDAFLRDVIHSPFFKSCIFQSRPCWSSPSIMVMLYQVYGSLAHCLPFLGTPGQSST
jgi:hypothetical protein